MTRRATIPQHSDPKRAGLVASLVSAMAGFSDRQMLALHVLAAHGPLYLSSRALTPVWDAKRVEIPLPEIVAGNLVTHGLARRGTGTKHAFPMLMITDRGRLAADVSKAITAWRARVAEEINRSALALGETP